MSYDQLWEASQLSQISQNKKERSGKSQRVINNDCQIQSGFWFDVVICLLLRMRNSTATVSETSEKKLMGSKHGTTGDRKELCRYGETLGREGA